jgi:hypothetical protein
VSVDDFDMRGASFAPDKANALLIVDADRMLPQAIRLQRLEPIARRRPPLPATHQAVARAPDKAAGGGSVWIASLCSQ